ncbi:hypothetical protein BH23BAC4_BH23BAC4_12170 [soil metagenome]
MLWHRFETCDEAHQVIGAFIERCNHQWLSERRDHRTLAVVRMVMLAEAA